ncbi:dnaJ homolog subfamily C member 11-like [Homarus americanus]|uniref:DnaJ subfamily C member 11-like n=1 Tax=Homarus americanus TaxID=6706 RepID=A0A8J5MWS6_HOMAM|nr:dnaJ homolog subfamily C member 11-like [Homarus americanus]KAG7166506.1 DnaJ subfamily C member 11-like [Homarus americanus]
MSEEMDDLKEENEDYYTFLNIPRKATDDEINNAYRRLSRLYHPDKHMDPDRKVEAELLFSKTKRAYEVLSDAHMRAIYDNLGTAGLETQGWEIVQRTKTPHEIREEYERLARDREERRLQQRTNPKSSVTMTINATDLFSVYDDDSPFVDLRDLFGLPHIEISGMTLNQAIEAPLTNRDTAILSGNLSSHNGNGSGGINCSVRRITSDKGWGEVEIGAGNGLTFATKGFRNFSRGMFGNASVLTHFTPNGLRVGTVTTLANQLDKHTVGYLTWKAGMQSGVNTMIIRDTPTQHLVFSAYIGIPHTYAALSYTHKMPEHDSKVKVTGKAGTFGAILEYGAEKKVSQNSSLAASIALGVPTGVQLKVKLHRASQTYAATIMLCEEIMPAPVIYGTLVPLLSWLALQKLIIQPYLRQQKQAELLKQREANRSRLLEKRREAMAAVDLMRETVRRIVEQEEARKGLVILQAWYGQLVVEGLEEECGSPEVVDVSIALQCLVKDSKLILQESSKCSLPGFYDPCPGEEKNLRVRYLFHAVTHEVTIRDNESLRIPKQSHRLET